MFTFFQSQTTSIVYVNTQRLLWSVCFAGFVSCSVLKSDLTIQPGHRFELGGNQTGSFSVSFQNVGDVPVAIVEKKASGDSTAYGAFSPGEKKDLSFASKSAVFVNNISEKPARLFLVVSGDKDLSMRER